MSIKHPPPQQSYPAVSIIIPMYNVEKYIGESLEIILAQTFTNFEVIIVDDCSTDNSAAIVESFIPKFDGRLKLSRTDSNTGGASSPRNKGLMLSRGEYIFFMDSDDKFASTTAVEEIFTFAKDFNADLVYFTKNYKVSFDGSNKNLINNTVCNPTDEIMIDEDLSQRVKGILKDKFYYAPWRYLIKRNLMIEHELFFPKVKTAEDQIFGRALLFHAKKLLIVPHVFYVYQESENSMTRTNRTVAQEAKIYLEPATIGLKWLANVMSKIPFFQENPNYALKILRHFAFSRIAKFLAITGNSSFPYMHKLLKNVFGEKLGEQDVLIAALFTLVSAQQKLLAIDQKKFDQFAAQAQKRIGALETQIENDQKFIAELKTQLH